MLKSLIKALVIGSFALTGIAGQAQAQPTHARCLKAPKDPMPCLYFPQGRQLSVPQGR